MTIWISREHPLFNFKLLGTSRASIVHPCQKLWPSELDQSFLVRFRASRYIMCLNRTSEWKVMTILISRELPLFNVERLYISWASIIHSCQKLWPFEFLENFHYSISSVSVYFAPESDIRVKSYDQLNFSRTSISQFLASKCQKLGLFELDPSLIVQFRASRYIIRLNLKFEW